MKGMKLTAPLKDRDIEKLKIGDKVLLSGIVYTARDAAHQRLAELLKRSEDLPIDIRGQILYYVGPTPAKPGRIIGSCGPTTSCRMDSYTPSLIAKGLKGMIGKGPRGMEVIEAIKRYKAVYFVAVGGAGALIAQRIKKLDIVAYQDLGPEAIQRLEVEDFPLIVANDCYGGDLFREGVKIYRHRVDECK